MCSIIGYIGSRSCRDVVFEGLEKLEYRGYDSAGMALYDENISEIQVQKVVGGVSELRQKHQTYAFDGSTGIGHTRWSTHGEATEENAHPHVDALDSVAVVHNGIIENFQTIKHELTDQGHTFYSQTDTEVIAHLLGSLVTEHTSIKHAVLDLVHRLEGAFACVALLKHMPEVLVVIRKGSPVCIGTGDNESFIASDVLAFSAYTKKALFLPEKSFALVTRDTIEVYDFAGNARNVTPEDIDTSWVSSGKQGFQHYMLKEIHEQKQILHDMVRFFKSERSRISNYCLITPEQLATYDRIYALGCGTSWHAAAVARSFFIRIAGVPCDPCIASEFRYEPVLGSKQTLCLAVSQSGETADTLEALRFVKEKSWPTLVITNVPSSSMVREADGFLLTHAKQEVSVASTKSFSSQVAVLYWFAHYMAISKGLLDESALSEAENDLLIVAEVLENAIEKYRSQIKEKLAPYYAQYKHFIFLGRDISYPFAREAALKLKELAYIFVDCYPAGELKHGAIALIDHDTPTILFSHLDPRIYKKLLSGAQEVKARRGHLVVFAFEGQDELIALADTVFVFPKVKPLLGPLAMTGLMQIFMYYIAHALQRPIDKPRNLAKSVTVE